GDCGPIAGLFDDLDAARIDVAKRIGERGGNPADRYLELGAVVADIIANHLDTVRGIGQVSGAVTADAVPGSPGDVLELVPIHWPGAVVIARDFRPVLDRPHQSIAVRRHRLAHAMVDRPVRLLALRLARRGQYNSFGGQIQARRQGARTEEYCRERIPPEF